MKAEILAQLRQRLRDLPSDGKGLDESYYCIDAEKDKELVEIFKILVEKTTGCNFRKIMLITVDDEGKVRPLFIGPAKGSSSMKGCCVSDSDPAFVGPNPYKEEEKILLRQNVVSITTHKVNPDYVCWPDIAGKWTCVKV